MCEKLFAGAQQIIDSQEGYRRKSVVLSVAK
jgi:hypothetical protein